MFPIIVPLVEPAGGIGVADQSWYLSLLSFYRILVAGWGDA